MAAKPEYILSKAVHSWVTGMRRAGVPILHWHMKNEGKRDAPQIWVEKALGIVQPGWTDSSFIISAPYKPVVVVMVELKVGKPTMQAPDSAMRQSQIDFRDDVCKPMAIPHYCVAAKTWPQLLPMLVRILTYHMEKAGYDTRDVY